MIFFRFYITNYLHKLEPVQCVSKESKWAAPVPILAPPDIVFRLLKIINWFICRDYLNEHCFL